MGVSQTCVGSDPNRVGSKSNSDVSKHLRRIRTVFTAEPRRKWDGRPAYPFWQELLPANHANPRECRAGTEALTL